MEIPEALHVLLLGGNGADALFLRGQLAQIPTQSFELDCIGSQPHALVTVQTRTHDVYLFATDFAELYGEELLAAARTAGRPAAALVLTAGDEPAARRVATAIGAADALVTSRLTPDLLERAIRYAIASRQQERLLAEARKLHSAFLDSTLDAMILADGSGKVVSFNRAAEAMFGYRAEDALGREMADLIVPPTLREGHRQGLARFAATGDARVLGSRLETTAMRADGSEFPVELTITGSRRDGAVLFAGCLRDITERKQLEQALRESERHFRTIAQSSPLGICLTDSAGNGVYVNPALERQLGLPAERALAGEWVDRLHPDDRERVLASWKRALERGEFHEADQRWVHPDGTVIHTCVRIGPIWEDGVVQGFVGVSEDITARLALEQRVLQSQKMEAIGNLAGGVAHDFNNMLAVINGYSELILAKLAAGDPLRGYVVEVSRAGERAAKLTRQLLAFSRKQLLDSQVLDLNEAVQSVDKMLRRLIGEDVEITTLMDPGLGRVKADPSQIEQVLMNLAVNARDAMPTGGKLFIRTRNARVEEEWAAHREVKPGAYVILEVADTGIGISAGVLEHLFEPFFTTKEHGKGTGLGLATVYGIVRQSDGCIEVKSQMGAGTTFTVYLPAVEQTLAPETHTLPTSLPRGSETILLVEDETMVRKLVRAVLVECGYTVLEAINGDEAWRIAEAHPDPIDLLLTDVVMPKMSGRELAERLKLLRPGIRILFMSGYTDDAVMRHGVAEAEVELLQKPFTHLALAQRVRRLLDGERSPVARGRVLVIDDDTDQRETLAEILEGEGVQVDQAAEGEEALGMLRSGLQPDLILLDLMMPGMNGWVFRLEQQNDPALSEIPVIVMSGQHDPAGVVEFLKPAGGLVKPVDVPHLLGLVEQFCRPAGQPHSTR